jgi:sugar transferase (PEP-CTERM/EpsH1 system associated)
MLHHLREHAEVELVSLAHDEEEASHLDEVKAFVTRATALRIPRFGSGVNAAMALLTKRPLTHALLDAPGMTATLRRICDTNPPDVVFAYGSGMARFAMQPPLDRIPLVLDFVDVDSCKWRDMAAAGTPPKSWIYKREAATLGAFEARASRRAVTSLVVNAREAANARQLSPSANVKVLANGVELDRLRPMSPPTPNPRVVFCGVMSYEPNAEGMTWFVRYVWPLVRAACPDATLAVVGPDPSSAFQSLCGSDPSITVTGRVPDVRDWLWESAVGIAPLHIARGVQNKALEAIAAGLPIVITDAVAGGLPADAALASFVANTPEGFANHILDLLARSPQQRRAIAASADCSGLTWARTLEPFRQILESAARRQLSPRAFQTVAEAHQ